MSQKLLTREQIRLLLHFQWLQKSILLTPLGRSMSCTAQRRLVEQQLMIGTSDLKMKACQQISSEKQNKNQQKC
jgi:hypothetical protein